MSSSARIMCYVGVVLLVGLGIGVYRLRTRTPVAGQHVVQPPTADEAQVVAAYNQMALQLYAQLRRKPGNLVISPCSIGTAMAMVHSGARGETASEMAKVLNQTLPREQMDAANAALLERLNRRGDGDACQLSVANALCLTTGGQLVAQTYRDLLATHYSAEVFSGQNVTPINAWVAEKTEGKIDKILEGLSANSVCVLLNAIYFRGRWASEFDKARTRPGGFYTAPDAVISVPMMSQKADYSLVAGEDFQAISLPYKTQSLAMIVILPREKMGLAKMEEDLTLDSLQSTLKELRERPAHKVYLSLPRFRIEFGTSLIPAFKALGMKRAFSGEQADFGGITGRTDDLGRLWIAQIQHKAFLEVNEEGTEAAAAAAIEFASKSEPGRFVADHPFLFLIVDTETDAILFMGRVTNPHEGQPGPPQPYRRLR
jgi:serpin B